ncbi:MAG: CopG family transcriptional regulator [Actinomycetota bacterium]
MRTTVNLDPDVEAEVARLRREKGLGVSDAVNALARRGMTAQLRPDRFIQRTASLDAKVDVTNIAEVLDLLDDE